MEAAALLARLAQYLGAALAFGWPLFAVATGAIPPSRAPRQIGAVLLATGAAAALAAQTLDLTGALRTSDLYSVLLETAYGRGLGIRLALSLGLGAAAAANAPRPIQLAFAGAATASLALTGHAAAGEGLAGRFAQGADAAHALAAAAWIGSLVPLAAALRGDGSCAASEAHARLARFSGLGSLVVSVLVLTGVVNAASTVGLPSLPRLALTVYGQVLIAKLALFAAMVGCAAANRFVLTPALGAALASPAPVLKRLRLSLAVETAAGLGVLVLAAALGLAPPIGET